MYYILYGIYIVLSTALGLWGFWWAVKNGQFRDQQRARYLPLHGGPEKPVLKISKFNRYQAYGLFGFLVCGLLAATAVVIYALVRAG